MATDSSRRSYFASDASRSPDRVDAMTVMEHLRELRTRIIISALAFIAISVIAFFFYDPLEEFLRSPLCDVPPDKLGPHGCELVFTKPTGGFQFRLKLTALVGLAATSPVWIYQYRPFVVPALTPKEKRYSIPFLASSSLSSFWSAPPSLTSPFPTGCGSSSSWRGGPGPARHGRVLSELRGLPADRFRFDLRASVASWFSWASSEPSRSSS